jgi:hypothetical protein
VDGRETENDSGMEEEKGGLFCFYVSLRFLRQKFALGEMAHSFFAESRNDDAERET